jgi:DNA-directed RNA polymerase specialized sigma24 family protein
MMKMTDRRQLLADYAQTHSEPAFREIVTSYLDLVYSCALRLVNNDEHRARDVAQIVFADLASMAGELSPEVALGGWLHRHTCFVAANTMRGERRRLAREREAVEMNSLCDETNMDFSRLAPLLAR